MDGKKRRVIATEHVSMLMKNSWDCWLAELFLELVYVDNNFIRITDMSITKLQWQYHKSQNWRIGHLIWKE